MDDRRFDSLAKSLAAGASRRSVLKGLLGFGGAALTSTVLVGGDTDAARRSTPTPTSVKCPGRQTWNGSACVCPSGLVKCGPDCCHSTVPPTDPTYSICCDQACCPYPNDCAGEELCCPRLPDVACLTSRGTCCTTLCEETPGGPVCCPADQFCAGGSTSDGLCCHGDTPIKCACGTNSNTCIADDDDACCVDADCDTPPLGSTACVVGACRGHVCVYTDCNSSTEVCCPDNTGKYACRVGDECCLSDQDCAGTCKTCVNFACVDDQDKCSGECETCVDGACVDDQDKCFGDCSYCYLGTCYADWIQCLHCESCLFDEETNTGTCVNDCGGCAECRATDQAATGACVPLNSKCLSCQVCDLNGIGSAGTCVDNCRDCGNCVPTATDGVGMCVADDTQCPETEVCCADGQGGFSCETGPECG